MTAHTPGPWKATCFEVWHGDTRVALMAKPIGREDSEVAANAHLIASAPDLLAALKRIKVVMDGIVHPSCRRPDDALSEVEAAIAKAENGK